MAKLTLAQIRTLIDLAAQARLQVNGHGDLDAFIAQPVRDILTPHIKALQTVEIDRREMFVRQDRSDELRRLQDDLLRWIQLRSQRGLPLINVALYEPAGDAQPPQATTTQAPQGNAAPKGTPTFTFDISLFTSISVHGCKTVAEARAKLRPHLTVAHVNFGAYDDGQPILGEAGLDDGEDDLEHFEEYPADL